jgi:hypothetical protein
MTPVFQDQFGPGRGNCRRAAVASVLGIGLHDLPDPNDEPEAYRAFLEAQGFVDVVAPPTMRPDCYYVAHGLSEASGRMHACVYRDGRLVHDPHPGRRGLTRIDEVHLMVPTEVDLS